jgi:5-methylcytosine-specific restriction endonuclease McrA
MFDAIIEVLEVSSFECGPVLTGSRSSERFMFDAAAYARIYRRNRWQNLRAEFFVGKSCVRCGSNEQLELDHIDPSTRTTNKFWKYSAVRRETELAKCQVLCKPCHIFKTIHEDGRIYRREWTRRSTARANDAHELKRAETASKLSVITNKEELLRCKIVTPLGGTTLFHVYVSLGRYN